MEEQNWTSDPLEENAVELMNLDLSLNGKRVFNKVNWTIRQGERIALSGQNGSGKSTLLSFLYADNPKAYSSNVRIFGRQRGKGDNIWDIKRKIGFTSTELQTYFTERISCSDAIGTGFFDTKHMPRKLSPREIQHILAFSSYFGISSLLDKNFQEISYGEQRLILFIRALVKFPALLLLDEPYLGFDERLIQHANALLLKLAGVYDLTLLIITHHDDELPKIIEKFYKLSDGQLVEDEFGAPHK